MITRLGIIGGSGLSRSNVFRTSEESEVDTPHGPPSSAVETGERVAFLARHGADHQIPPHRINHRANLWALKEAGASAVVGSCSVGSLQAEIAPGNLVVPDDYVSFWEIPTYFDDQVQHITPTLDPGLRQQLVRAAKTRSVPVRDGGVYVQTRGPRLETKAEVRVLRKFGDIVGMTMATEATLAQELDLRYASLCSVDNYSHGITKEPLTFEDICRTQEANARVVQGVLQTFVEAAA
ncbi:MAG: MTAP family purine nucleoside phosphorylase [Candidatus Thermoplasmatota archaeon]|nr:MTAP family purine nucleoside phosphorylase [Candidatus Thermoplasmatota archaeon]